jgi:hypothetical protein
MDHSAILWSFEAVRSWLSAVNAALKTLSVWYFRMASGLRLRV